MHIIISFRQVCWSTSTKCVSETVLSKDVALRGLVKHQLLVFPTDSVSCGYKKPTAKALAVVESRQSALLESLIARYSTAGQVVVDISPHQAQTAFVGLQMGRSVVLVASATDKVLLEKDTAKEIIGELFVRARMPLQVLPSSSNSVVDPCGKYALARVQSLDESSFSGYNFSSEKASLIKSLPFECSRPIAYHALPGSRSLASNPLSTPLVSKPCQQIFVCISYCSTCLESKNLIID
jgi:hypothetical protein